MRMIDTQILIKINSGQRANIGQYSIASTSAKEFLFMYGPNSKQDNYYLILQLGIHANMDFEEKLGIHPGRSLRKKYTDKISVDFKDDYGSIVEFGNIALSHYINNQNKELFSRSLTALPKQDQKNIMRRFEFIINNEIKCFALEEEALSIGLDILSDFMTKYTPKNNFLNTARDAFILGVAVKHRIPLQTEDKILAKLSADKFGAGLHENSNDTIIDFDRLATVHKRVASESKGYINRGWRIGSSA